MFLCVEFAEIYILASKTDDFDVPYDFISIMQKLSSFLNMISRKGKTLYSG